MPAVRQLIFIQIWFRHWKDFRQQAKTETAYYQLVSDYLNSQENVEWDSEEHTAEYVKAFSDTQSLAVKVSVFWTDRTADSTASDTAASDTVASDTAASDTVASDTATSDTQIMQDWT